MLISGGFVMILVAERLLELTFINIASILMELGEQPGIGRSLGMKSESQVC